MRALVDQLAALAPLFAAKGRAQYMTGAAFYEGEPCCTFGHALSRAGYRPPLETTIRANDKALASYLRLPVKDLPDLVVRALVRLAIVNDRPNDASTPEDREEAIRSVMTTLSLW